MAKSRAHALRDYTVRRFLLMIPTFFGITIATFVLCQIVPGGPIDQLRLQLAGGGGEAGGGGGDRRARVDISDKDLEALRAFYHFDKPIALRYVYWIANIGQFDLGTSTRFSRPVIELVVERLPISLYYGLITTILTYSICVPLGIVKALRHRTFLDTYTSIVVFIGYAIPGFALGAVLLALFAVTWQVFPLSGFRSPNWEALSAWGKVVDQVSHSILPLISYLVGAFAVTTLLMKNSLMENMSADYVKTALAKGLTWKRTIFVHAVRNSMIPIATTLGHLIGILLTGSLLVERVFGIPGMGLLNFEAIQSRDYPVVLGIIVIGSLLLLLGNLLSDLIVAMVDPRVRFE